MRKLMTCVIFLGVLGFNIQSSAGATYDERTRIGAFTVDAGGGVVLDPNAMMIAVEGDYFFHHNIAVGPRIQLASSVG